MTAVLVFCVRFYRHYFSPVLHELSMPVGGCRYYPSCSEYAIDALRQYGLWRGSRLLARRLARCHPFAAGGYDPLRPNL
ncbi:MAG: membrane protein insertion efficiency factor YidD [Candidatus Sungbacteria bacterium]|uniref:Putative membrane protein insertion efficiency factor n=1 Tax=Candidatus Sungiibacteriota bacterium TaxID=2750080 RepID=A0A931SC44_9BACT|nr:membrane protein insertion efficiency factor YidD [Candidatus Sungbacteria bacterium]